MSKIKYKQTGRRGLFDKDETSAKLTKLGNPLEKLHKVIDFEMFRDELEAGMLNHDKESKAGNRPFDVLMMFKIVLLKRVYNLSDEQAEYQITDRLSFKEFLGLSSGDRVPDARTIWLFQENLIKNHLDEKLFAHFRSYLHSLGLLVNEGKIIDASFVEVPRQHNTKEENAKIKAGKGDELWNDHPYKKRQKDIDARWTKKNKETFYGYKDHGKVGCESKLIDVYAVSSAELHDSQATEELVNETDGEKNLWLDSAYVGEPVAEILRKNEVIPQIIERAYRNKPLTEAQKASNKEKSKIRCRVEHVFGFITNSMNEFYIHSIGFKRAKGVIGLINLTYNMCRFEQIVRLKLLPIEIC